MSSNHSIHYKEVSPHETVAKLKGILSDLGLEMDEKWCDESFLGTYSLRLTFKGTDIGTNGKGISKEYALASAYGELFERYQNKLLGITFKKNLDDLDFYEWSDEKIVTAKEVSNLDNSFMKLYFRNRSLNDSKNAEKAKEFKKIQKTEYMLHNLENKYIVVPFYSTKNQKVTYLPNSTYRRFHGSNGMCAGNTPAEALVQGLSEIIERVVQKKLFLEKPTLPDIPEEEIKKYPYIFDMFKKLKKQKEYYVSLKDCSFGGKYPVAALVVVEKDTGNYGVKLGCHPCLGVAMERAFTEATQGNDIFVYAKRSVIDFSNSNSDNSMNIYNSYKIGGGHYPYQLFGNNPTYKFTPFKDVSSMSNEDILKYWVNDINNDGYDVMIRDVSSLGFPSYHIVIPGLSEMWEDKDIILRAYNTRFYITSLLMNPQHINKSNIKYVIGTMEFFMGSFLENTMSTYCKFTKKWPCSSFGYDTCYFVAMCHAFNKDFGAAAKNMNKILQVIKVRAIEEDTYDLLNCIYHYFVAMDELNNHKKVIEYIGVFFNKELIEKVDYMFSSPEEVLIKFFELRSSDKSHQEEVEDSYSNCKEIFKKLRIAQKDNPINQGKIRELFSFKSA